MMVDITYKGQTISVNNEETIDGDKVVSISAIQLFVSEPDDRGQRYAFDIKELEDYIIGHDSLINFYAKPIVTPFSASDISELQQRSPVIRAYIKSYINKNKPFLNAISLETLNQMQLFLNRSPIFIKDEEFLETVRSKYEPLELRKLESAGVSLNDLARGEAFKQFKTYYGGLSKEEKKAIDNFPGISIQLRAAGLISSEGIPSLSSIFNLKAESCLGGAAGICERIIEAVKFAKQLNDIPIVEPELEIPTKLDSGTTSITYKGQPVSVANTLTIKGNSVEDIAPDLLFVSEPDVMGGRYAFNIEELEEQIITYDSLNNFYAKPREFFSISEVIELQQRSHRIRAYIESHLERNETYLDVISSKTLEQMQLFLNRSLIIINDEEFLETVRSKYGSSEFQQLESAGVSLNDLARGEAFEQFKTYYNFLSREEKKAIDTFPGIQKQLELFNLVDSKGVASLSNIFSLGADGSLGGSAGICEKIITAVTFLRELKNIPEAERGFDISKEVQKNIIKELDNYIASRSDSKDQIQLNWMTRFFRNPKLTSEKLTLAFKAKEEIQQCTNFYSLVEKIKSFKDQDSKLEKEYGIKHKVTHSGLSQHLENIESVLSSVKTQQFPMPSQAQ